MSLIDDLVKLEEEAKELVAGADDAEKLEAARVALLGRKGRITGLMRMMGKLAPEDAVGSAELRNSDPSERVATLERSLLER